MNKIKLTLLTAICIATAFTFSACEEKGKKAEQAETKEAGETQNFRSVKIGSQTWMAENLSIKTGNSWCYENNEANCTKYGRLYDWETAKTACPKGWHLPSNEEWEALVQTAGGENVAGKKLKSKTGWHNSGNGTDEFGFSALPSDGKNGNWWSATENLFQEGTVIAQEIRYDSDNAEGLYDNMDSGLSVRCVKD